MATNNTKMTVLMNELNANIRQGFASPQEDFCAESNDSNDNRIVIFKDINDYQNQLDALQEEGTPYLLAVIIGRQKTEAEKKAEAILEKAAIAREKKNAAQNKRRAKQREAEVAAKEEMDKKEPKKEEVVVDVSGTEVEAIPVPPPVKKVVKKLVKKEKD